MFAALSVVVAITALANAAIAVADLRHADFVVANSTEVGVPQRLVPVLAVLKGAGAAGLVVGVIGIAAERDALRYLGLAAAVGLVLFFTGALIAHVRAGVFHNIYFPGIYWMLGVASLVLLGALA